MADDHLIDPESIETQLRNACRQITSLQQALNGRVILEQAKGMLAQAWTIAPDEAFDTLRRYARSHHHTLRSVAEQIVRRELPLSRLRLPPELGRTCATASPRSDPDNESR